MTEKDRLYDRDITRPEDFVFDERVVRVFPDMINRSVPGYAQLVPMIGLIARRHAMPHSRIYDLGCSLGAVSLAIAAAADSEDLRVVAVDNSDGMIARLRSCLADQADTLSCPVDAVQADIRDIEIRNASVVVLNFTLQFVPVADRQALLDRIEDGLNEGGVLLLSEKMRFEDPVEQRLQSDWHYDFKRAQGYSELEIARKRDALENVLQPDSPERHHERLAAAGFTRIVRWFQGFNFVSLAAFK